MLRDSFETMLGQTVATLFSPLLNKSSDSVDQYQVEQ